MNTIIQLTKSLKQAEFGEKDIQVYLELVKLGEATPQLLARNTKLKRTTVYVVLERLEDRGVIGSYTLKKGKVYRAGSLDALIHRYSEAIDGAKTAWSTLEQWKHETANEPRIITYRGSNGLMSVLEDTLLTYNSEIFLLGTLSSIYKTVKHSYNKQYIQKRISRRIQMKTLCSKESEGENLHATDSRELRETRFLPDGIRLRASIFIYEPQKVAYLTSEQELIATVIQSKDIYELEKTKFELLWEQY